MVKGRLGVEATMRGGALLAITLVAASLTGCVGLDWDSLSGCGSNSSSHSESTSTSSTQHDAELSDPVIQPGPVGIEWPITFAPGLTQLEVVLSWELEANDFSLEVERPSGEVERYGTSGLDMSTSRTATIPGPTSGEYVFRPVADAPAGPDSLQLQVTSTIHRSTSSSTSAGEIGEAQTSIDRSNVTFEQTGDGYRAIVTYEAASEADEEMTLNLDTFNGDIHASAAGNQADVRLTAWADGDTEHEALDRLRSIAISYSAEPSGLLAQASGPSSSCGGMGADVVASVPASTTVTGLIDTSNGEIILSELTATDLEVDTSNGEIIGSLTGQGEIGLDTSNGEIELSFQPTGDTDLQLDTSNGEILLRLLEGAEIGYELDADTSNGEITESMREASIDGDDEDEGTLRTNGYSSRAAQVSGSVDTSNGEIHFEGR